MPLQTAFQNGQASVDTKLINGNNTKLLAQATSGDRDTITSHLGILPRRQNTGRLELSGYRNSWRYCFDDDTFGTKYGPSLLGFVSGQLLKRGVELQARQALQAHATNRPSEGCYDKSLASLAAYLSGISVAVCGGHFTGSSNIVHQHQRLRCLMSFWELTVKRS